VFGRFDGRRAVVFLAMIGGMLAAHNPFRLTGAPPPLRIVDLVVHQYEDGPPVARDYQFYPNDTVYVSFRVANYSLDKSDQLHLSYQIQALDPEGRLLAEPLKQEIKTEVTFKDKEAGWRPIVRYQVTIPSAAPSGEYKIFVQARDELSGQAAQAEAGFRVQAREVPRSDTLVVRNFYFYPSETSLEPLVEPVYHPGDTVWARFDITGYKFGPRNRFSIDYGIRVLRADGSVLFDQPVAAQDERESFYPEWHTMGVLSLNLTPDLARGDYTIVVTVRDHIGNQTYQGQYSFHVR